MSAPMSSRRRVAISAFAMFALVMAMFSLASVPAKAGDGPFDVFGTVTDSIGNPVEGAAVTIIILETSAEITTTTESDGSYSTPYSFDLNEWNVGDTVRVVASKGADSGSNQMEITDEIGATGYAVIDVQFGYEIPEFGGLMGMMVAMGAVGAIGSLIFMRRKR